MVKKKKKKKKKANLSIELVRTDSRVLCILNPFSTGRLVLSHNPGMTLKTSRAG